MPASGRRDTVAQHAAARPHSKRPRVCLQNDMTETAPAAKRVCHISKPAPSPHVPDPQQACAPAVDVPATSNREQTRSTDRPMKKAPSGPGRIGKLRQKMDKAAKRRAASKRSLAAPVGRRMGARQHIVPQPCDIFATDDQPAFRPSQAAHQPASGLLRHAASLQAPSECAYRMPSLSTQSRTASSSSQPAAEPALRATSASGMEQTDPMLNTRQHASRHAPGKRAVQALGKQEGIELLAAQHANARSATGTSRTSISDTNTAKPATVGTHSSQPAATGSNTCASSNRKRALEPPAEHVQPPRKLPRAIPRPTHSLPGQMAWGTGEAPSSACIVLGTARSLQPVQEVLSTHMIFGSFPPVGHQAWCKHA